MTIAIKDRPILFSAPMVLAILNGQKIQTRRILKSYSENTQPYKYEPDEVYKHYIRRRSGVWDSYKTIEELAAKHCPYGKPGERLWVRETWRPALSETHKCFSYRADLTYKCGKVMPEFSGNLPWKPSIFMPKEACRVWLEIESVRIERLQEISEKDAISEGFESIDAFRCLWDSLNKGRGAGWDVNPFAWVIGFRRVAA